MIQVVLVLWRTVHLSVVFFIRLRLRCALVTYNRPRLGLPLATHLREVILRLFVKPSRGKTRDSTNQLNAPGTSFPRIFLVQSESFVLLDGLRQKFDPPTAENCNVVGEPELFEPHEHFPTLIHQPLDVVANLTGRRGLLGIPA